MGSYTGDGSISPRGNMIHRWLQGHSFILWNQCHAYGKPTFIAYQDSSIIDFFMSDTELCNPSLTIREGLSLDSAHKMISFSYHPNTLSEAHSQQIGITWRSTKLQDARTRNQYIQSFQNIHFAHKHLVKVFYHNKSLCIRGEWIDWWFYYSSNGYNERGSGDKNINNGMLCQYSCCGTCQLTDTMAALWALARWNQITFQ